ncbi:MAG: polymerase, partial [Blastococcus sp.]|nr:polymerase [Blastococcus sp.]
MSAPVSAPASTAASTSSGLRPRLLLLDGHSLAYRAFFALPVENFSTTTGQP